MCVRGSHSRARGSHSQVSTYTARRATACERALVRAMNVARNHEYVNWNRNLGNEVLNYILSVSTMVVSVSPYNGVPRSLRTAVLKLSTNYKKLFLGLIIFNLPGHGFVLHFWDSSLFPTHTAPPNAGAGLLQDLTLV